MTQSDKIKARLRRLLAMTTDNGASEAEALAAAEAASRLMHEHNLSYRTIEDIDADAFGNDTRPWFTGAKGRRKSAPVPKVVHCLPGIERLCGVKHLFSTFDGSLTFFGAACDTEVAHYLTSIISRAMDREWHTYQQRIPKGMARTKRASFYLGIGARISSRLIAMADEQKPSATSGAGLVLVKDALEKSLPFRVEKALTKGLAGAIDDSTSRLNVFPKRRIPSFDNLSQRFLQRPYSGAMKFVFGLQNID